ncbi:MAG TPA: WD40 repeat domain-containing protein [Gemmataceae bacterium]|jgi:WD40 repeat protein|nr:WD40 repeat domain-containing protein [Gemmataceae bacterium]
MASEVAVINAHGRHAQAVRFTRDGKLLVSVGQDACVRLWSVPGFGAAGAFEGHKNSVNSISFTPDEQLLATGSTDGTVRLWAFPEGRYMHTLAKQVSGVFAPDGDRLATISAKGQVVVWEARSGKQITSIPAVDKRTTALAFSPDGKSLLIGGTGPIHRVAVTDGRKEGELNAHKVVVACLQVSPDRRWLASTGYDGHLRLWSTKDWASVHAVKLNGGGCLQIAFSPQSDSATVAADYRIQTYSVKDGKVLDRIELPLKGLYGVAISPDGKYVANAAADGKVRVWERRLPTG